MGLYRDENGQVVEMDDAHATGLGLVPYTADDDFAADATAAQQARGDARGALGDLNAALTGIASGGTLGASDVILSEVLTDNERERAYEEIQAAPIARTVGEITGAVAASFANPASALGKTPAGYLNAAVGQRVTAGMAQGGIAGTAKAVTAMGVEGATQAAGSYIGMAALGDKKVTVEALAGAMGTGFVFGSAGGGAALGVSKGVVSARKLFAKTMDASPEALKSAEQAWKTQSDEVFNADLDTAELARRKLEDIRLAKREAQLAKQRAATAVKQEEVRAAATPGKPQAPDEWFGAEIPRPVEKFGPDEVFGAAPRTAADDVIETAAPGPLDRTHTMIRRPGTPEAPAVTDLELQLAGTADGVAQGKKLRDIAAPAETAPVAPPTDDVGTAVGKRPAKPAPQDSTAVAKPRKGAPAAEPAPTARASDALERGELFGDRKVFISSVYENMDPAIRPATLDDFKQTLIRAQQDGKVTLHRADMVAAMDPKLVQASESLRGDIPFHFIDKVATKNFDELFPPTGATKVDDLTTGETLGDDFAKLEADLEDALSGFDAAKERLLAELGDEAAEYEAAAHRMRSVDDRFMPKVVQPKTRANKAAAEPVLAQLDEVSAKLDGAQAAGDDMAVAALSQQVEDLEEVLLKMGTGNEFLDDVARKAQAFEDYQKASAKLADAMGDEAHPASIAAAKASADAEKEALRMMQDRMMRTAEDAEMYGPVEVAGPQPMTPKARVKYAKARKGEADLEFARLKEAEMAAKMELDALPKQKKLAETLSPEPPAAPAPSGKGGQVANAATALELLPQIPGMPKPSDIPVVGPLLGTWLKFRALKAVGSRFAGKVPATGNTKVAMLAAKTKERIAKSLDRALGAAERNATQMRKAAPPIAGVLASRLYDDGGPDAKAGAPIGEVAAVRIRELAALVHTPGAIEKQVRKELRDVTDPDIIAEMEKHRRAAMQWLLDNSPKMPPQNPLVKRSWQLSPGEATAFARRYGAIADPASVFEAIEHEQDMITLEAAQALRAVYPSLFAQGQQFLFQQVGKRQVEVPYRTRLKMSMAFEVPLDSTLEPGTLQALQSVYDRPAAAAPAPMPGAAPTPAIANPTNLTALFQTADDRRASR